MEKDDLDFFTEGLGFSWYYQLLQALELAGEELDRVTCAISGYTGRERGENLRVSGKLKSGVRFSAYYYLSGNWQVPGESVFSLQVLEFGQTTYLGKVHNENN